MAHWLGEMRGKCYIPHFHEKSWGQQSMQFFKNRCCIPKLIAWSGHCFNGNFLRSMSRTPFGPEHQPVGNHVYLKRVCAV